MSMAEIVSTLRGVLDHFEVYFLTAKRQHTLIKVVQKSNTFDCIPLL